MPRKKQTNQEIKKQQTKTLTKPLTKPLTNGQCAGAFMGQGASGCTFLPAVSCTDMSGKSKAIKPNRIGKVFGSSETAAEELTFAKVIKKIDPQQRIFYYPDELCLASVQDVQKELQGQSCSTLGYLPADEKAVQLLMPNGGQTITDYLEATFGQGRMSRATMAAVLERIFIGVQRLIDAGYVHQDLKTPNIVAFAGPNGKHEVRIIDFGLIVSFANFYHSSTNFMMEGHDYYVSPPEYRIPLKLKTDYTHEGMFASIVKKIKEAETEFHTTGLIDPQILKSYRIGYTGNDDFVKQNVVDLERFIAEFDGRDYDGRMRVLERMNAASKSDLWSVGNIMLKLAVYLLPAADDDIEAVKLYNQLVSGLLHPNPAERITITEALRFVKKLKKTGIQGSPAQNEHFHKIFTASRQHPSKQLSPTQMTKMSRSFQDFTVREIRASDAYKKLTTKGKSRLNKNELIRTIVGA